MRQRHFGFVSDADVLLHVGPHIEIIARPHPSYHATPAAAARGAAVKVRLLIDTGSQRTWLGTTACRKLGFPPVRFDRMTGVDGEARDYPIHLVRLGFGVSSIPTSPPTGIIELDCEAVCMPDPHPECGHEGLLGRDVLRHFELWYDGPRSQYYIQVPEALLPKIERSGPRPRSEQAARDTRRAREREARKARRKNRA